MQYTNHYKIPKPGLEDTIKITDIHSILDKVDTIGFDVDTTSKQIKSDEETRIKNEKNRVSDETKRVENEKSREIEEEKRKTNEKARQNLFKSMQSQKSSLEKAELNRVSEWNSIKKDATNVKNSLDSTVNNANKTNENLSKVIEKGNTLKDQLTPGQYALKSDITKMEKEFNDSKIKTITKNSNIISLENNVEGIANVTLEGNTIDINKEPIILDFKNKTQGNTSSNPNIAKCNGGTRLLTPTEFSYEIEDINYENIYTLDGQCTEYEISKKDSILQQLFSFDLIKIVEKERGTIPGSSTEEKVEWLKKNVESIICNWWGYGECSTGNIAYLKPFKADENKWLEWGKTTSTNIAKVTVPLSNVHYYIDKNGFVSFLAHTDKSDGKTPSVIYTDYINLEVQLKTELQSVAEEDKQIEIKSVGKNLFNINAKPDYTQTSTYEVNDDKITITSTKGSDSAIVRYLVKLKINTTYTFSVKSSRTGSSGGGFYINDDIGNILTGTTDLNRTYSFTTKNTGNVYIWLYGEQESRTGSSATYWDIQLKEGLKSDYEPYKEDKVNIPLKEPLRGLPNGVRDTVNSDGTITRRVGKVVLDGSENWEIARDGILKNTIKFSVETDYLCSNNLLCDKFKVKDNTDNDDEGINSKHSYAGIRISKSKLSTQDVEGFKKYLKENPVTLYYELAKPTTENISQPLNLKTFEDGHIVTDTEIAPFITVDYPTNMGSRISSIESAEVSLKDSLGGAWKSLLILADKDLKMKSISPLKTTTAEELKNKINEIIGVW